MGTIKDVVVSNCRGAAVKVVGDAVVEVDGLTVTDTPEALVAEQGAHIKAKGVQHHQTPDEPRPRKYFAGFSFSKGDHLKD